MSKGKLKLNHLTFGDDMNIPCNAEVETMNMISEVPRRYEKVSRQMVNKEKSAIYLHHSVSGGKLVVAEVAT